MTHYLFVPGSERLSTPFEDWCDAVGVHPEAFGAWEGFSAWSTTREAVDHAQSA